MLSSTHYTFLAVDTFGTIFFLHKEKYLKEIKLYRLSIFNSNVYQTRKCTLNAII